MKRMIIKIINNFIYITKLYKLFATNDKVVLLYHRINKEDIIESYYLKTIFVDKNQFYKQMKWLSNSKIKDKIIITFDDGYYDNYLYAFPILTKFSLKSIFFVTIDFISNKQYQWIDILNNYANKNKLSIQKFRELSRMIKKLPLKKREEYLKTLITDIDLKNDKAMSWDNLKEMSQTQIIANHTINHPNFSNENIIIITNQIKNAKQILKEKLDIDDKYFAYPDGDIGQDKKKMEKILQELNYQYAFTTKRGVFKKTDNYLFINRIPIYYSDNLATFVNKCHGINIEDNFSFRSIISIILTKLGIKNWIKKKLRF